jgi:hypothetical protein
MRCDEVIEGLAKLAAGGASPEAVAHAAGCLDCATRLAELDRVVASVRQPYGDAPYDLIARAQALMNARPRLVARLLGNSLSNSGARRVQAQNFALYVGVEDFTLDLHYAKLPDGWELLGRAPTADWRIAHSGGVLPCGPSGRFRLVARDLDGTAFVLCKGGTEIEVPSARELIDLGL